jgi:8-oxo-dGTP pyrophosphatase MutT (NUDIX family)
VLSCGILLARPTDDGLVTLMLRAYHHWDFPKGLCEDGETPLEAAIRELREETGIDTIRFDWGERFMETGPYSRGKTARYYLASTEEKNVVIGPSPDTGEPEHHEWRWVSFDEAYDLSAPRVREVVQWGRQIIGA